MRTSITLFLLSLSIVFAEHLYAQSFEFRVMVGRGENSVKLRGSSDWQSIKTGTTVFSGSEIQLAQGGYLGLMHKSGKTMDIKTPGVHKVDELAKTVMTKGSSVASKYGEFLLAKMNTSGDQDVSASKLNNLNVTGAVSRATGDDDEIQIFLPKTSKILDFENSMIKWKMLEESKGYKLYVDNLYSETIAEKEVNSNFFNLADLGVNIEQEGGIFLRVTDSENMEIGSSPHAIELITGSDNADIREKLDNLKKELTSDDVSLNKLILAMFYEENKLYLHAFSCYHEVLQEYPDVDFYKSAYLTFVERNKDKF